MTSQRTSPIASNGSHASSFLSQKAPRLTKWSTTRDCIWVTSAMRSGFDKASQWTLSRSKMAEALRWSTLPEASTQEPCFSDAHTKSSDNTAGKRPSLHHGRTSISSWPVVLGLMANDVSSLALTSKVRIRTVVRLRGTWLGVACTILSGYWLTTSKKVMSPLTTMSSFVLGHCSSNAFKSKPPTATTACPSTARPASKSSLGKLNTEPSSSKLLKHCTNITSVALSCAAAIVKFAFA